MRKSGLAVKINCSRVNSRGCPRSRSRPWLDSSAVSPRVNAWLPSLTVMLAANVAAALLLAPPCLPQGRRLAAPLMDTPSMKAQMVAAALEAKALEASGGGSLEAGGGQVDSAANGQTGTVGAHYDPAPVHENEEPELQRATGKGDPMYDAPSSSGDAVEATAGAAKTEDTCA